LTKQKKKEGKQFLRWMPARCREGGRFECISLLFLLFGVDTRCVCLWKI